MCGGKSRASWCFTITLVTLTFLVAILGLFMFDEGRMMASRYYTSTGEQLLRIPEEQWTPMHKLISASRTFVMLFVFISTGADRRAMFEGFRDSYGPVYPFQKGYAITSHKDVAAALQDPSSRGPYIGARQFSSKCFTEDVLIFQSNGKEHAETREVIMKAFHGMNKVRKDEEVVLPGSSFSKESTQGGGKIPPEKIQLLVTANILTRVFGETAPVDVIEHAAQYFTSGGLCAAGTVAEYLEPLPKIGGSLEKVQNIREHVFSFARNSIGGKAMIEEGSKIGWSPEQSEKALQSVVDGVLFAGLLGTGQLTGQTFNRIMDAPQSQIPLYKKDKLRYLKESARLQPPVTSVTHTVAEDKKVSMGNGLEPVAVAKGTTVQVIIATANSDPAVFGGKYRSKKYAETFDPSRENLDKIVSWNGVEMSVQSREGPRWCLGHDLSLDVATKILDYILPTEEEAAAAAAAAAMESDKAIVEAEQFGEDYHELKQVTGFFSLCVFVIALLFIICTTGGPVATSFAHIVIAMILQQVGLILDVSWIGYIFKLYEAGAMYILRNEFKRRSDRKGPRLCIDFINILIRIGLPMSLVGALYFQFGDDFPLYTAIITILLAPARVRLIWSFAQHWGKNGWLLSEFLGLGVVIVMFTPVLKLACEAAGIKEAIVTPATLIFNSIIGLPLVVTVISHLDNPTPESIADEEGREGERIEVTAEHKEKARSYAKEKRSVQGWFMIRAGTVVVVIIAILLGAVLQNKTLQVADGNLCPFGVPATHKNNASLCEEDPLKEMDLHTRFMYIITHFLYLDNKETPPPTSIEIPTHVDINNKQLGFGEGQTADGLALSVIRTDKEELDLDFSYEKIKAQIQIGVKQFANALPLQDISTQWPSIEYGREMMKLAAGEDLPKELTHWDEMESDEAISRICFAGFAAHRIDFCGNDRFGKPVGGTDCPKGAKFVVDVTFLSGLEVRSPFERYGAAAFFDENQKLVSIYWSQKQRLVLPDEKDWAHVKWAFKCSLLLGLTAVDHLVGVHLMVANFVTQASKSVLSPDHPLRRLLEIHTHHTIEINAAAARTLCRPGGLVHHASALTATSLITALHYGVENNRWDGLGTIKHVESMFKGGMTPEEWPFGRDYLDFFNIVMKFSKSFLSVWYKNDNDLMDDKEMVDFHDKLHGVKDSHLPYLHSSAKPMKLFATTLAAAIVGVTGFHNHIGMVAEYLKDPTFMAAKIRAGETYADIQSSFQCMNIAMLTGFKAPMLMGDYSHMLEGVEKEEEAKQVFAAFQEDLKDFAKEIKSRNEKRKFPCNAFNPERILSSVSI